MKEFNNYKMVKEFLAYNKISCSQGFVIQDFNIKYYVGDELRYQGLEKVHFKVQHPEFINDLSIVSLDCEIYYCGFRAAYQNYEFNEINNMFIIKSKDSNNKHGKVYRIEIKTTGAN